MTTDDLDPQQEQRVRHLLADAGTVALPPDVFVRMRQAISEQVQLRHEDADAPDGLDADLEAVLAAMLGSDDDPEPDGVQVDGLDAQDDEDELDDAEDCPKR